MSRGACCNLRRERSGFNAFISDMADSKTSDRREFLKVVGTAGGVGLSAISGCMTIWMGGSGDSGGGEHPPMQFASQQHRITQKMATHTATDRSSLINAVGVPEATVWIPNTATIDMTGVVGVPIAPNVTIASDRRLNDAEGGMIKTDGYDNGVFINESGGCRVTGIRLKGPRMDYFEPWQDGKDETDYSALGFSLEGQTAIVDHCEVAGWTFAGIALGAASKQTRGWIHHNSMHHNQMNHLGYPMELYNGLHLIEWNYFDHNRHSIAGFGYPNNGYEARFNVVGPNAILHAFDMHYLGENLDELGKSGLGMSGGEFVNIHHNVFELTSYPAFSIQGIPQQYVRFCNNWSADTPDERSGKSNGVALFPESVDVRIKDNTYGPNTIEPGRQRLREIESQLVEAQDVSSENPPMATPTPMDLDGLLSSASNENNTTDSVAEHS